MNSVTVKVRAKVNLSLNVKGINGKYHDLESVMVSVSLFDLVTATATDTGVARVRFSRENIENSNAQNLADIMMEKYSLPGVDIFIEQNIPEGGGVGGSSADGAGVIRAIDTLFGINAGEETLRKIAERVGSDIPFMVTGGCALIKGRGEKIERFAIYKDFYLLISGKGSVSTKECFALFDKNHTSLTPSDNEKLVVALKEGDIETAKKQLANALQDSAMQLNPYIKDIISVMESCSLTAVMTGSGSCVMGFGSLEDMEKAQSLLRRNGTLAEIVKTEKIGYEIV